MEEDTKLEMADLENQAAALRGGMSTQSPLLSAVHERQVLFACLFLKQGLTVSHRLA